MSDTYQNFHQFTRCRNYNKIGPMVNTTSAMWMLRPALTEPEKGKGHLDSRYVREKMRVIVGTYDWGTNQIISFAD